MGTYYDENPNLFRALNLLKANSIVYETYNPVEYRTLKDMRPEANRILAYDGCKLDINVDIKVAFIRFVPSDEYINRLKAKFSANDMKVYVCLLQLYEENFNVMGPYVQIDIQELQGLMINTGFDLGGTRKNGVSLSSLKEYIQKFVRYGILKRQNDKDLIINPGILTCVSRSEFNTIYDEYVKPWIVEAINEKENEETDVTGTDMEPEDGKPIPESD